LSPRKHIPLRTQLAATLCALLELPYEQAKAMTEDEVIGMVEFDHQPHRYADGGKDSYYNLRPLLRHDHKAKTRHDASDRAKERRVRRAQAAHEDALVVKSADPGSTILSALKPPEWTRWPPARPFPKRQRGFDR
jgi:hypothetical protein